MSVYPPYLAEKFVPTPPPTHATQFLEGPTPPPFNKGEGGPTI